MTARVFARDHRVRIIRNVRGDHFEHPDSRSASVILRGCVPNVDTRVSFSSPELAGRARVSLVVDQVYRHEFEKYQQPPCSLPGVHFTTFTFRPHAPYNCRPGVGVWDILQRRECIVNTKVGDRRSTIFVKRISV